MYLKTWLHDDSERALSFIAYRHPRLWPHLESPDCDCKMAMRASFILAKQSVLSLLHIVTFRLLRAIKSFWLEELCRAILFELMLIGTYTHFYIRLINGIVWMIVFNFTFSRTPTAHLPDKNIAKTCAFIGTLTGIFCLYPSIPNSGNVLMYIYCVNKKLTYRCACPHTPVLLNRSFGNFTIDPVPMKRLWRIREIIHLTS